MSCIPYPPVACAARSKSITGWLPSVHSERLAGRLDLNVEDVLQLVVRPHNTTIDVSAARELKAESVKGWWKVLSLVD